jgi:hypothetical protein
VERRVHSDVAHPRVSLGSLSLQVFPRRIGNTGIQGVVRSDLGVSVVAPDGEEEGEMLGDGEGSLDINHILKY